MNQVLETLARINKLTSTIVKELVDSQKSGHQALVELIDDETNEKRGYALYAKKLENYIIGREGDIVVGFFTKSECEYEVGLAYYKVQKTCLRKNQFTYALFDSLPILLICTRFHEVTVNVTKGDINDIYVIYAVLATDQRRFIAQHKFYAQCNGYTNKYITQGQGMYSFTDDLPDQTEYYMLQPWIQEPTVEEMIEKSKDRTSVLLQDLAESSWKPNRFMHWCLAYDEVPEDTTFPLINCGTKLYLDEVIMIEDAPVNVEEVDQFLNSQRLRRVGQFNRLSYQEGGGLPLHKDNPLQGGEVSVAIYLNNPDGRGHIVFPDSGVRIMPKKGRCLIFDVNVLHYVEPIVSESTKDVLTCECVYL